eukprot:855149-Rhodomonas_salina.2
MSDFTSLVRAVLKSQSAAADCGAQHLLARTCRCSHTRREYGGSLPRAAEAEQRVVLWRSGWRRRLAATHDGWGRFKRCRCRRCRGGGQQPWRAPALTAPPRLPSPARTPWPCPTSSPAAAALLPPPPPPPPSPPAAATRSASETTTGSGSPRCSPAALRPARAHHTAHSVPTNAVPGANAGTDSNLGAAVLAAARPPSRLPPPPCS